MADFATVVKELESQNKVLGDIKRNTTKPKKDAGDRETERENAAAAAQQQATLGEILSAIKMGSNPPASKGGGKSGSGFNLGNLLKGGAILGGLAGLAKAIMNFIMNPFGILLKAGKWILKAPFRLAAWSIKKLAKAASNAIWGALKMGWGFTKKLLKTPLKALKVVGQSILGLAQKASNAIRGGLGRAWGFVTNKAGVVKDLVVNLGKKGTEFLKNLGSKAMTGLKSGLQTAWGFAKAKGDKIGKIAVDLGKKGTEFLKNLGTKALGGLRTGLTNAWSTTVNLAKTGKDSLLNLAKNASTSISNAVSGLWQGAKNKGGKAISLAKQLAQSGISKVSHGVGMLKNFAVNGANAVKGALGGVMGKITGLPAKGAKGAGKLAATIGKTMLKGAKFIPGAGLAVTGALALYEGFSAGFDTYKKTGNFGKAVKDGAAGALSSLTFGLVSKETISSGFDAIGSQYTKLTDGVVKVAGDAWTGVKKLIPTKEQMTTAWNAVGKKLAPLKDITLPKEFSVDAVKTSLSSVGTSLNAAVKNMTGLDIGSITTKFPSLESIKDMLPNWLTNPVGWVTSWFKDAKAPKNPEELKTREYQATLEESQDRVRRLESQLARTKQVENRGYGQSGMEKRIAKAQEELRLSKLYVSSGGKEGKESVWNAGFGIANEIAAEKGDFANKADRIKKLQARLAKMKADDEATHKEIAKHNAIIAEQQQKIAAIKKHTGGTFTSRSNFLIAPGEMMINPQSSGLVLNRSATNAIMSAGLNRIAQGQSDTQDGGSSPTLINAPRVNNSQVTNNTIPIRRSLPIVPSMVG